MATIKEVAQMAGVSIPTAYRAFNNSGPVGEQARRRVLEAARVVNYEPKGNAATNRQRVIGIIVPRDITSDTFYSNYLRALNKELYHYEFRLMQVIAEGSASDEYCRCVELLQRSRAEGIIYFPKAVDQPQEIAALQDKTIPVLQLFKKTNEHSNVLLVDDVTGAYLATREMIRYGHRRILFLQHSPEKEYFQREDGYCRAFREAGLPVDEDMLVSFPLHNNIKGMVKERIERLKPTAIFAISESVSSYVLQSLRELHLSTPRDISLVMFDDTSWAAALGITAVGHPFEKLAISSAQLIIQTIKDRERGLRSNGETYIIDPQLIMRDSVDRIPMNSGNQRRE